MGGGPTTVNWRGVYVDPTTAKALDEASRIVGDDIYLRPIQGSYSTSTSASSGTHDGGGAIDLDLTGYTDEQADRVETTLRKVGFAAWRRLKTTYWKHHAHGIRQDCGDLSSGAKTQVGDYKAGYNGLPIGGRINKDTGTRAYVDVTWGTYEPSEEDDMPTADEIAKAVHDRDVQVGNEREPLGLAVGRTRAGTRRAEAKVDALATALGEILAEVEGVPADVGAILEQKLKDAVVSVEVNFPVSEG